jgi:hypothetical protein
MPSADYFNDVIERFKQQRQQQQQQQLQLPLDADKRQHNSPKINTLYCKIVENITKESL